MGKPRLYGYFKPAVPNNKADQRRNKPTPGDSCRFDTGVHMAIPEGFVGFLKSKSGLNVNYGIQSEGVIDSGYTGSIVVKLFNHGEQPVEIKKGQKISQLVLLPIITPVLCVVKDLEATERGNGGFGSTGKF